MIIVVTIASALAGVVVGPLVAQLAITLLDTPA